MRIMGLQKMTLLDYPGNVACTVFFGGCNFRCPYCHNASLVFNTKADPILSEEEFFSFLARRKNLLDGVCITGGEPMLQRTLPDFISRIREMGFLVKLDTNGSFPKPLSGLLENHQVDYVAMDIKNSKKQYGRTIGVTDYDTSAVEQSVELLKNTDIPTEFRTTLVREYHTEEDLREIGTWLEGSRAYYLQTFVDSGNLIGNMPMTPFEKPEMERFANLLKTYIETVSVRGV